LHPDARHVVVISGGDIYIVNPDDRSAEEIRSMARAVIPIPERGALLINETLYLSLIDRSGFRWRTKRLAWEELRNLSIAAGFIHGEGLHYLNTWHEFQVSLDTGEAKGGAYASPEP
jgi:hypothetical protein